MPIVARRPLAPHRGPAGVRGHARVDPGHGGRDGRRTRARARRGARAAEAMREADEERRRARRERDEAVRRPATRQSGSWTSCATRCARPARALERQTITAPAHRPVHRAGRGPPGPPARRRPRRAAGAVAHPHAWRLGERAHSRVGRLGGPDHRARARRPARHARSRAASASPSTSTTSEPAIVGSPAALARGGRRHGIAAQSSQLPGGVRHPPRRSAWTGPAASRRRSTCAARASRRRWTCWAATSTTRRWPASTR